MNYDTCVSIITVSYNSSKTIEKTIKSVLNQTYDNIEYIIIDGNSSDGTKDIIKMYESKFEGRMKWISEEDNGIYDAMNKGINMASGKWVGIINSDDWYHYDAITNVVNCDNNSSDPDVIFGNLKFIYNFGEKDYYVNIDQPKNLSILENGKTIHHPSVFIKKKIYDKFGVYNTDYKLAADYELLLRFYLNNLNFKYCNANIAYFRAGGASNNALALIKEYNQIKSNYGFKKIKDIFDYYKILKNILPSKILEYLFIFKWKINDINFKIKKCDG
jgi:glycosyltransferase involved in cell wall biosynthesis